MGALVGDDDLYISSFFEIFNLRFGVEQRDNELAAGGFTEMVRLQQEFDIFSPPRKFVDIAQLLGLGGLHNNRAKNRWFKLLTWLQTIPSDTSETGDERIVNALYKNFTTGPTFPCFMKAHDSRDKSGYGKKVHVIVGDNPIFYISQPYVTISLPLAPDFPPAKTTP